MPLRTRLGGAWSVVALLVPVALCAAALLGPRAGLVLALSVLLCVGASVLPRVLAGAPWRWLNPGTLVTGLLLGLTLSPDVPLYMIVVGAFVAEIGAKARWPRPDRNLLNPAAAGRGAIALLEIIDPPGQADLVSGASPLFKGAGGLAPPELVDVLFQSTGGSIGGASALVVGLAGALVLAFVVIKRSAAVTLLATVLLLVAILPATPEIWGHAPWVRDPVLHALAGGAVLSACFFATDPMTTPDTRLGGVAFGLGAGALSVLGRLYTTLPGPEMWAILVMNLLSPGLDRAVRRLRGGADRTTGHRSATENAIRTFYAALESPGDSGAARPPDPAGACGLRAAPELDRSFPGLRVVLESRLPGDVLDELNLSGLRGCGGAHFPVGAKWSAALAHPGPRILVVNGQEGEPGSAKDRLVLEQHALRVVEGAAITAHVLDCAAIHVVLDPTFEAARGAIGDALRALRTHVGHAAPPIHVHAGPGLYVCGEETALIAWLEGERGEPRPKPPHPAERGLFGRPTVVHNVETLFWLPEVLEQGGAAFRAGGPPKLVTLGGAVERPGVYSVPLGTTLERLVELGGGARGGDPIAGFAIGGPSGGLLPASAADLPIHPKALSEAGAPLGSGIVRVLGVGECVVKEALDAARFHAAESCGRCTPCRVGTEELRELWAGVARGSAPEGAMERISELSRLLAQASTCGLGAAAPTRIDSVRRYWPGAVDDHLQRGGCPTCDEST